MANYFVVPDERSDWQRRYDESVRAEDERLEERIPGPRWAWAISAVPGLRLIGDVAIAVDAVRRRRRRRREVE